MAYILVVDLNQLGSSSELAAINVTCSMCRKMLLVFVIRLESSIAHFAIELFILAFVVFCLLVYIIVGSSLIRVLLEVVFIMIILLLPVLPISL